MAYTSIDSSFSIESASAVLSPAASEVSTEMNEQSAILAANPDDPAALANFNASVAKWSVVMNVVSTINKVVKDASMSIVQKM
ncbi:EscF/YscF/HrpA family type III secretion system needle major subunit [Microbulbifer sp. JMSA003]|uniref:EscF/YscF/HrpA family type III secretion system needle major subunit n=1 Tax=unclassified Microbulbifer TaxID=2619833 RepID=UPI004039DA77